MLLGSLLGPAWRAGLELDASSGCCVAAAAATTDRLGANSSLINGPAAAFLVWDLAAPCFLDRGFFVGGAASSTSSDFRFDPIFRWAVGGFEGLPSSFGFSMLLTAPSAVPSRTGMAFLRV